MSVRGRGRGSLPAVGSGGDERGSGCVRGVAEVGWHRLRVLEEISVRGTFYSYLHNT